MFCTRIPPSPPPFAKATEWQDILEEVLLRILGPRSLGEVDPPSPLEDSRISQSIDEFFLPDE
jgi:hypothetical protein